jgi:hypothetical protein
MPRDYASNPMLRLMESYVLWCIDELPEADRKLLDAAPPEMRKTFNRDSGSWQLILMQELGLPADMRDRVRDAWDRNRAMPPNDFAVQLTDSILGK